MKLSIKTDVEYLHNPSKEVSWKKSLETKKQMHRFLLYNKPLADSTLGLASNQLGLKGRVIMYRSSVKKPMKFLINPMITYKSDDMITTKEDCLSVPNKSVYVERHRNIIVQQWEDEINCEYFKPTSYESIVIQHEIDHLNGIIITDYKDKGK